MIATRRLVRLYRRTAQGNRVEKYSIGPSGIANNVNSRPTEKMPNPALIANARPSSRPRPVDATDGQTVITATSRRTCGATPAIACFIPERPVAFTFSAKTKVNRGSLKRQKAGEVE